MLRSPFLPFVLVVASGCTAAVGVRPLPLGSPPPSPVEATAARPSTGPLRWTTPTLVLERGEGRDLIGLLRTADGQPVGRPVVWTSSREGVARVGSTTGRLEGVTPGTSIVTASLAGEPEVSTALEITVVEKHAVVLIQVEPGTPRLQVGRAVRLRAQVTMADGQVNGNVRWTSSDDTLASVDPDSGEVTAHREGKVTIVASYVVDSRYKGLAEVEVLRELPATLPPTSGDIVFRPGATPLPTFSRVPQVAPPAPSPRPTVASSAPPTPSPDTPGRTVNPGVPFTPPSFAAVRNFSHNAVYAFVDPRTVIVAEETRLTVTTNGGRSWTVYGNVGSQAIRAMFWPAASDGWVAGEGGSLLKVRLQDGALSFDVKNAGTDQPLSAIHFLPDGLGLLASYSTVWRSHDGGETWTDPVAVSGDRFEADGLGSVVCYRRHGSELFRLQDGAFARVQIEGQERLGLVRQARGTAFVQGDTWPRRWYRTTDWVTFTLLPEELVTTSRVLRDRIEDFYPLSDSVWLARYGGEQFLLTRDAGKTWSDPVSGGARIDEVHPFSETMMWAVGGQTLYRSGTP